MEARRPLSSKTYEKILRKKFTFVQGCKRRPTAPLVYFLLPSKLRKKQQSSGILRRKKKSNSKLIKDRRATHTQKYFSRPIKAGIKLELATTQTETAVGGTHLIMPLLTREYLPEPSDRCMKEARDGMSKAERDVYDFFVVEYNLGKLTPNNHFRTRFQKDRTYLITSPQEWDTVESQVEREVEQYAFLALDTEGFVPPRQGTSSGDKASKSEQWQNEDRLTFVLLGTMAGNAYILDMDQLSPRGGACPYSATAADIPPIIRRWIVQEEIYVCGSGIAEDITKMDLYGTSLVDTKSLMLHALTAHDGLTPLVDLGDCTRCGMGAQSFYSRGYDTKPYTPTKYASVYGKPRNPDKLKNWPDCKRYDKLYSWPRYATGNLKEYCLFYLFVDSTTPVSLLCRLAIDMLA